MDKRTALGEILRLIPRSSRFFFRAHLIDLRFAPTFVSSAETIKTEDNALRYSSKLWFANSPLNRLKRGECAHETHRARREYREP